MSMNFGATLVGAAALTLCSIAPTTAQQSPPERPRTLLRTVWFAGTGDEGLSYRFYSDGIYVRVRHTGGNSDLGVDPRLLTAWGYWFVRYPNAPDLDPHELCVHGPNKSREEAGCGDFRILAGTLFWDRPQASLEFAAHKDWPQAALEIFDTQHSDALKEIRRK
jgi:hypothetical protein